jgi:hypothetical protein
MKIEKISHYDTRDMDLYLLETDSLSALSKSLSLSSQYFLALVVCDCRGISDGELLDAMKRLLSQGASYIHGWGPDSTRIDTAGDFAVIDSRLSDDDFIGTSWEDKEPIEEAIWYILGVAFPSEYRWNDCKSIRAIVVNDTKTAATIRAAFSDPDGYVKAIVNEEPQP